MSAGVALSVGLIANASSAVRHKIPRKSDAMAPSYLPTALLELMA